MELATNMHVRNTLVSITVLKKLENTKLNTKNKYKNQERTPVKNLKISAILFINNTAAVNPLDPKCNYSATSNNTKLVHWPLMGGLLRLVQ